MTQSAHNLLNRLLGDYIYPADGDGGEEFFWAWAEGVSIKQIDPQLNEDLLKYYLYADRKLK